MSRKDALAVARFIPDCIVLFKRLLGDPAIARWRKAILALSIAYLAFPLDLIPDFLPVIGQMDDALVVVLALRMVLRGGGASVVQRHWPGPERSLVLVLRLATD